MSSCLYKQDSIQLGISLDEGRKSSAVGEKPQRHRLLPEDDEVSPGRQGSLLSFGSFSSSQSPHLEQAIMFESSAGEGCITSSEKM